MRLVVVSDTHGNLQLLEHALSLARARGRVDAIVHLGDEHTDLEGLARSGEQTWVVPGIQHPDYGSPRIPIALVREIEGVSLGMAHQPSDLPPMGESSLPRLYLHGHTHSLTVSAEPWGARFNPGHLAQPIDRGRHASFGIVEINKELVSIFGLGVEGVDLLQASWPHLMLARDRG